MDKLKVASKIIGGIAAAITLYDAHKNGVRVCYQDQKKLISNNLPDKFLNSQRLESESNIMSHAKDKCFDLQVDGNANQALRSITGYMKGFSNALLNNLLAFGCTVAALFGHGKIGKPIAVTGAIGLTLIGIKDIFYDILGMGKPKDISL